MGSYTFSWAHAAQEVYVTGTFDNWSKSVKLEKDGDVFRKTVELPVKKIEYKFVVDGEWVTDSTARQETDQSGNLNNVVEASEIQEAPASNALLSSVAPQSSTAALAAEQPLQKDVDRTVDNDTDLAQPTPGGDLPGAFPVTPMNDMNNFFVKPIPATEGAGNPIKLAPGEPVPDPSTLTDNTVQSTVRDDPSLKQPDQDQQTFGVNPIPATAGIGNPIKLAPGEPVPDPSTLTDNTVQSTVRDDAQYGVSDTGAPVLPPVLDKQGEAEANGAAMFGTPSSGFGLPSSSSGLIPESSLPMGDRAYNEPSLTTSSVGPQSTTAQLAGQVPLEPRGVPEVVSESQQTAHVDPEASASPEAVREKSAVEDELKRTVSKDNSNTDSSVVPAAIAGGAATAGAVLVGGALLAKDKIAETYTKATEPTPSAKEVPDVVTESQHAAHVDPEASASPEAVHEKAAFEDELKHTVHEAPATSESGLLGKSEGGLTGKIVAGTTAAGVAAAGIAYAAKDKAAEAYESATGQPISNITKEPTVDGSIPSTVTESQEKAHVDPEASSNPEAVREKTAFESELLSEVQKAPATSSSGVFGASEQGIAGVAAAGTAAVAGAAYATKDKAADAYQSATGQPTSTEPTALNDSVPATVLDSQEKAHVAPEASANPEAVHEKAAFENELKSEVSEAPATSESGVLGKSEQGITGKAAAGIAAGTAALGAGAAGVAYATRDKAADAYQSATGDQSTSTAPVVSDGSVPSAVLDSQEKAHAAPEASANAEAVREKSALENELKSEVSEAPATSESGVLGKSEQGITGKATAGIAAGTAALGAGAAGVALATRNKAAEVAPGATTQAESLLPPSVRSAIDNMNGQIPDTGLSMPGADESSAPAPTTAASLPAAAPAATSAMADPFTSESSSKPSTSEPTKTPVGELGTPDFSAPSAGSGLNASAASEAQTPATRLAAPEASAEHSRDVSPMTRPDSSKKSEPTLTTGVQTSAIPTSSAPVTPQKSATKRASSFFRGTPDSVRTTDSGASKDTGSKRKSFLAKLKDKFKS